MNAADHGEERAEMERAGGTVALTGATSGIGLAHARRGELMRWTWDQLRPFGVTVS